MAMKIFKEKVLEIVAAIPKGSVLSYGEVAKLAGNSRAARAVGAIMRANHNPKIPCHRVVAANSRVGGYNRGVARKLRILKDEGVVFP